MVYFMGLICSCLVTGYIFFAFMDGLYERKYNNKWIYCISLFSYLVIDVLIAGLRIPALNIIFTIMVLFGLSYGLYNPYKKSIIINTIVFFLYLFSVDLIATAVFSTLFFNSISSALYEPKLFFVTGLANMFLLICTYRPFLHILKRYQVSKVRIILYIYMLFLMVFEIGILYYEVLKENNQENNITILIICIAFMIVDLGVLYLYQTISKTSILERKAELLEQQRKMVIKYTEELQERYDNSKKVLHDVKKHLNVIEKLQDTDIELKKKYAIELKSVIDGLTEQFQCNNKIIKVIIWDKMQICENESIIFDISMQDIEFSFMDDMDITILFANLLDNAVEACSLIKDVSRREISLRIHKFKYYVVIKMKNTTKCIQEDKKEEIINNSEHEGIGLEIIKEVVEKYGGNLTYGQDDGYFETKIILPDINDEK